ncbi:hypothetical protein DICPUDRAFT_155190 [Dictyostelium purpureum]|uniref:Uncharacterized protein n=1 Tax=Dictyostelium purpureum TaxID=5786 RepID=F0ZTB4_DICPU|nr:uncharacterized protein DICPUDRAFT_155190 [Dictyostelium purpureum]EGC32835.1 hypothetical protein DICPUDRAFT_155190 [Dictyostelium purpureum]|eukprot:XP_003290658.1 hypothetical protein DICPUDRAFT_155190 [Dictyostelium purpureum]
MSHSSNSCNFYKDSYYVKDDFFNPEPFREGCCDECRQNFLKVYIELRETLDTFITLFRGIKLSKDGKIPMFSMFEVADYYEGKDRYLGGVNKNIQDLFDINLLDLNIPFLKKRKDIPKDAEESSSKKDEDKEEK